MMQTLPSLFHSSRQCSLSPPSYLNTTLDLSFIPRQYRQYSQYRLQTDRQSDRHSLVIIWFSGVPVLPAERLPRGHPDKLPLLPLVSPRGPEVLQAEADALDVVLQQLLLGGGVDGGEVEAVVPAVLSCPRPVGLDGSGKER